MIPRTFVAILAVASLAAGGAATTAVAQDETEEGYALEFSSKKPRVSAGFGAAAIFAGDRVIDQITIKLPQGTKFNTSVVEQCNASKEEIQQQGGPEKACPEDSKVGGGTAKALVGENELEIPLTIYNRKSAFLVSFQIGSGFFSISPISGRTITIPLGSAAEIGARATEFTLGTNRFGTRARP